MRRRSVLVGLAAGTLAVIIGGVTVRAPELPPEGPARAGALLGSAAANGRSAAVPDEHAAGRPTGDRHRKVPIAAALRDAWRYGDGRGGLVSFAVVDSEGKLRGRDENRSYSAASVVKAMLLAAEVRRLRATGAGIDLTTDSLLTAMITYSDK